MVGINLPALWTVIRFPWFILYGYWRPYIMDVIYRYLDCGDRHFGFARVKCAICGHEYLLA